jgi:transcriptional regulator with XRE-family HTH domain
VSYKKWHHTGMETDRLGPVNRQDNPLGTFLKSCRAKRDPSTLGFTTKRRRTPGLRREEVAQLANVSATWYTWLEQGRGGSPSADVLEGIVEALALTAAERDYLFLLALGHVPEAPGRASEQVSNRLQRILDSLNPSPAYVKNTIWDILAWNRSAEALFLSRMEPKNRRNMLENLFCNPAVRQNTPDWESVARVAVAAFRADSARAADQKKVRNLVNRLIRQSEKFDAIWQENEVASIDEGSKTISFQEAGSIALEYSTFTVDGQPDLNMVVYTPSTPTDAAQIHSLIGN